MQSSSVILGSESADNVANNYQTLVIEKEGIVFENDQYMKKTVREEIDTRLFNRVIQILGYQGFNQKDIQDYIFRFGEFLVNDSCLFLEAEVPELSDYKNMERRKHFV